MGIVSIVYSAMISREGVCASGRSVTRGEGIYGGEITGPVALRGGFSHGFRAPDRGGPSCQPSVSAGNVQSVLTEDAGIWMDRTAIFVVRPTVMSFGESQKRGPRISVPTGPSRVPDPIAGAEPPWEFANEKSDGHHQQRSIHVFSRRSRWRMRVWVSPT